MCIRDRYLSLLKTLPLDFRVYKSIFYNKKAANFIKFAAFLPISGISFPIFIREHVQICYNIIPFKSSISYSFICYLQGLSSFPDYKDTTFKRICQEEHPIKFIPNVFIRNIAPLLLIFCVENLHQSYEHHSLFV